MQLPEPVLAAAAQLGVEYAAPHEEAVALERAYFDGLQWRYCHGAGSSIHSACVMAEARA